MEELKLTINAMSKRQRLEFYVIVFLTVLAIAAFCFIVFSTRKTVANTETVEALKQQNQQLAKNNELLISTVNDLNTSVQSRSMRDSFLAISLEHTANALPVLTQKLNQIDIDYDKKINAPTTYNVPELEQYARAEADRLRREGIGK